MLRIKQANTYEYEKKHFGKLLDQDKGASGQCFKNVKNFCKEYRDLGKNVSVSLVAGMRGWDDSRATMCYHYLVRDDDTYEFADPQYWRYTFIEIHNWSLEDYQKECEDFELKFGYHPAQEIFSWYCLKGYGKAIENFLKTIKSLSNFRLKLSDKSIEEYCRGCYDDYKPLYGTQVIKKIRID